MAADPQSAASPCKPDAPWTVRDARVNLSALLNDPGRSRRDYDLFTKTWGETFKDLPPGSTIRRSKYVPNVVHGHFQEYMDSTGDRLLRHESQLLSSDSKASADAMKASGSQGKVAMKSAIAAQNQREATVKTRLALDALPKIFLKADFAMDNPATFTSVLNSEESSNDSVIVSSSFAAASAPLRKEVSSSKLLQEKLSHYLDMVEIAIVRQISLRSDTFFKAMTSHDELDERLNSTLSTVQSLLAKVKQVDQDVVQNALQVVNLRRAHFNSVNLLERLRMVVTVHQTQPTIQLLLSSNEYAGSLDLIRTTQEVLHQELAGLHCFRHLSSQLTEMESVIGQMMRQEIDECLTSEIHRPLDEGHLCLEPHRIRAVTHGLLRQGQFDFFENFRFQIESAVKSAIKELVSSAVEKLPQRPDAEDGKSETLASKMRMLVFDDWIALLDQIFDNLLALLRRVKSILDVIAAVASDSADHGDVISVPSGVRMLKARRTSLAKRPPPPPASGAANDDDDESKNPFLDSDSTTADEKNPFLTHSPEKRNSDDARNPFLDDSPVRGRTKHSPERGGVLLRDTGAVNTNPFVDDDNDLGPDMYGLASYEDELISSAADSYNPPTSPADKEKLPNGHLTDEDQSDALEQSASPPQSESDTTTSHGGDVITREEHDNLARALRDFLCWTCDFEQDRCVKVLIAKGKDTSLDRLSSGDFLRLAKSVERFTSEAEAIVRRQHSGGPALDQEEKVDDRVRSARDVGLSGSLRGALRAQAGRFVSRFHDERRSKLSLILDNEMWKQAEVPAELSQLLQDMVDGRLSQGGSVVDVESTNHRTAPAKLSIDQTGKATEYLVLDSEKYAVVGTVLILLKMVSEYCKCSDDLPTSTSDLVNRLRDLLTLFNSRTCQLVLGAGALQLVGLKTITTKNLALASRCLQLVLHCLPAIRSHFEAKLMQHGPLQARDRGADVGGKATLPHKHRAVLRHFDHVTKDYQDHVTEIENKLVTIVGSVFDRHLAKWEVKAPMPSSAFRNICKQVAKFHETIGSLLPENQTRTLLIKVNDDFKSRMRVLVQRFGVRRDGGPQHGLVTSDLAYYETNIKNLQGMADVDLNLSTVWS